MQRAFTSDVWGLVDLLVGREPLTEMLLLNLTSHDSTTWSARSGHVSAVIWNAWKRTYIFPSDLYSGEKETRVNHQHLHGRRCVDSGDIGEGQEKRSTGQGDMVCHARRCLCDVLCVLLLFRDSAVPSSIPILRACCFPLWANRSCAGIALLFLLSPYRTPQPTVCHSFRLKHKP
jgi:hypothetical protein